MSACTSGLTVSGTGMLRPGTVRGPFWAFAALCAASRVAKAGAGLVWLAACSATEGTASAAVRIRVGMTRNLQIAFVFISGSPFSLTDEPARLAYVLQARMTMIFMTQRSRQQRFGRSGPVLGHQRRGADARKGGRVGVHEIIAPSYRH